MNNFEHARRVMVDTQLRPASITDRPLLAVMGTIPRERFVPDDRMPIAYVDTDHILSLGGRALASAATFAKLVQLADVQPDDVVLDVGSGTGYSLAVLAALASAVVGIEDDDELIEKANANLSDLDIGNAAILKGTLEKGVPAEAPFDVIVIEGAVKTVPEALLGQLRDGGRLVAMINTSGASTAQVFVKTGKEIAVRSDFDARMPALRKETNQPAFIL